MASLFGARLSFTNIKFRSTALFVVSALIVGSGSLPLVLSNNAQAAPMAQVVYNALPSISPKTNYPSQPFQAQQTSEFGDYVHLGGTARTLDTVTVTMSDWALYADYQNDARYSSNHTSWTHPITLNVYSNHLTNGVPDQLLASTTQTVTIPWRPAANPSCSDGAWKDSAGDCVNGIAFNATFDLSGAHATLPHDVIVGVVYNTQTYGPNPIGVDGPYNSLNVAVPPNQPVTVGNDDSTDAVFWNTATCSDYADGGTAGCGVFREDTNWTPYGTVALQITATPSSNIPPTGKDQCKNGGWKQFTDPSFKNQGQCVAWVNAHASGDLQMSEPGQRIVFNVTNKSGNGHQRNRVAYWNYDYPGGVLHYSAAVDCSYVNPLTKETRFMFQIPAGHAGLSGLYVVSYAKEISGKMTPDLYGHAATSDLATATQWCQTGVGFAPQMYPVIKGSVDVD